MTHSQYTAYFRSIAEKHVGLAHSSTSMHFARIVVSAEPFRQVYLEEVVKSLKGKMKMPFMVLETYMAEYRGDNSSNLVKHMFGSFIIIDRPKDNPDAMEEAFDLTEQIGEDIIAYLRHDFRNDENKLGKMSFALDGLVSEKVGPFDDNFVGTRFDFKLLKSVTSTVKYNPAKFV